MALPDDWSYQLAQAFLTAAMSCAEEPICGRVFVSDNPRPEGMPPDCPCQLAAVVVEGWEPQANCGVQRRAEVRLVLDLCVLVADQTSVPEPVAVSTQAQANAAMRWQIMRGVRQGWVDGALVFAASDPIMVTLQMAKGLCREITPDSWHATISTGGAGRWETTWRYAEAN